MAHAKLSASGSATWANCPASIRIVEQLNLPEETSEYAEEGTKAHEQAEAMLSGKPEPYPEMASDVLPYVELVRELSAGAKLLVEQQLSYDEWVKDGFGTSDAVILRDGEVTIVDLKFGKGVQVFADSNYQLRLYALGALQKYQFEYDIRNVTYYISQPRLDHVSAETISMEELLTWGEWIKQRALLTEDTDAVAVPSAKACQWCKARYLCRARAIEILNVIGSDVLTPDDIGMLIPFADKATKWAKDITQSAFNMLDSGIEVKGYKLVEGDSNRKFLDSSPETLLANGLTEDQIFVRKMNTMGNIEKCLKDTLGTRKAAQEVMSECTVKPVGAKTLVKSSDPRPAIVYSVDTFPIGE